MRVAARGFDFVGLGVRAFVRSPKSDVARGRVEATSMRAGFFDRLQRCRIDADSMTAVPLPHFKLKLRDVSKELYLENGWKMPRGFIDCKERDPRNFTLDEWQQAKRHGHNAKDMKALMQECWAASDSSQAFANALQERGLYLARGDRRGHVAVTYDGEVLSISRMIGKPAKEVVGRLGDPAPHRMTVVTAFRVRRHCKGASVGGMGELVQIVGEARLPEHREHARECLLILDRKLTPTTRGRL